MQTLQDIAVEIWTNPSVVPLAEGGNDPVEEVIRRARTIVLDAMSEGWNGPPFDPSLLASMRGIAISPRADIADARIISDGDLSVIEFNPNRPRARIRYSIAHEIAHTLFDDWFEKIRYRSKCGEVKGDDWQLEMLCNIAAAEMLMPFGSLPDINAYPLSIDRIGDLRKKYEVSLEAILLRAVKLSSHAICAFAASRVEEGPASKRYRIDYLVPSQGWKPEVRPRTLLPIDTVVADCTAIGFTTKGAEIWNEKAGKLALSQPSACSALVR